MTTTITGEDMPAADAGGIRRFISIEDMILFHRPELEYLVNLTLPVRPATEAEQAAYEARRSDEAWAAIYAPAEPHVVLPPSPEVAAITESAAVPAAVPETEPGLDEHAASVLADFNAAHDAQDAAEASATA